MNVRYRKCHHSYICGVTVHSLRPLVGEGLGVRAVVSKTYPLTLALSLLAGGEGAERLRRNSVSVLRHLNTGANSVEKP